MYAFLKEKIVVFEEKKNYFLLLLVVLIMNSWLLVTIQLFSLDIELITKSQSKTENFSQEHEQNERRKIYEKKTRVGGTVIRRQRKAKKTGKSLLFCNSSNKNNSRNITKCELQAGELSFKTIFE